MPDAHINMLLPPETNQHEEVIEALEILSIPVPKPDPTTASYQYDSALRELSTTVLSVEPFALLPEPEQQLFKLPGAEAYHVVVTDATIFHPQGGGQPSDVGTMRLASPSAGWFNVLAVRKTEHAQILHLGVFSDVPFGVGEVTIQAIDEEARLLHSRFHTAV
jgi:Ser-tRNA(Ala) deacylase AlaX